MAVRDYFKVSRKTFFNPRGWLGWESLCDINIFLRDGLKSAFTPAKPLLTETFEEAMKRLDLTEEDVQQSIHRFRIYAFWMLVLGLLAFAYAFFLLFSRFTLIGWLLGVAVSALLFSQAFKYDFWALQMRRRELGLSFADWKRSILGLDKDVK